MLVTQSRGHNSQKKTLLPPAAPSSPTRAGFQQPTGADSTNFSLLVRKGSGEDFPTALSPFRHLEMLFPSFPPQYQALGSRMLQNKTCEEVPGHDLLPGEVSGFMVLWKRRMEEDKECRRLWEVNLRRGGVGCQEEFWTNPEHRGLQCLQLVCRHGNGLAKDGRWKNKPGAH